MPSKNRIKQYAEGGYYHVYNRGLNKQIIFKSSDDYAVFLNLFKRYLDRQPHEDNKGREYQWLRDEVELMAYCLMPNHFHMLVHQKSLNGMTKLLQAVGTSYTGYFNKKYGRAGPLFQDVFKASLISDDAYLVHIGRYIHLNPSDYKNWEFSSYKYFLGTATPDWLSPGLALEVVEGQNYEEFISESIEEPFDDFAAELADI